MAADVAEGDDGFLSRWARRKAAVQEGKAVPAAPSAVAQASTVRVAPAPVRAEPVEAAAHPSTSSGRTEAAPPLPTLDDVAALTKDSDFSRFVAHDTDPTVKNAAMKKLFASDPHFNTMDGLDVYIDDYNKFEPIPRNLMRQLVNARAMGLLDDELPEQPAAHNPAPVDTTAPLMAPDEDPDLQLQPHDAAGPGGVGEGVADGGPAADDPPDPVPPRSA
jgi:Protein of unknown function (DUF3306)